MAHLWKFSGPEAASLTVLQPMSCQTNGKFREIDVGQRLDSRR